METAPAGGGLGFWWLWLVLIIAIIWFAGWGWGGYGGWWWGRRGVAPVTNNANASPTGVNANATINGNAAVAPTGDGVAILNATNKREFVGQHVDIRDVYVQKKINDRALWIGNTGGNNGNQAGNNAGASGPGNGAGVKGTTNGSANPNATTGPGGLGANTGNAANNGTSGTERAAAVEVPTLVLLTGANNTAANNDNNAKGQTPSTSVNGSLKDVNQGELVNVVGTVEKAPAANVAEKDFGISRDAARQLEHDGAYIRATEVTTAPPGNQK